MKWQKRLLAAAMSAAMILSVSAGCTNSSKQTSSQTSSKAGEQKLIGNSMKYDVNSPINDGKPITLLLWTDPELQPFYAKLAQKYHEIHQNVTINIVSQPWADYWTKLPLTLNAGNGPDIYRAHANRFSNLREYTYELPDSVFPSDKLTADFPEVMNSAIDGKLYSVPVGSTFTGGIYYNKTKWKEAGLTDKDIPKTWDKFAEVCKKLTKKDTKGNVTQYGFSADHDFEGLIMDMNLGKGQPTFQKDQFTWNLDNDATYENIAYLKNLKTNGYMMNSDGDAEDQFGHGQAVMMHNWNWVAGYFNQTYPNVDYGFFPMPTADGSTPPACGLKNYEWSLSVSSKDEAKRAVSFDVIKYYLCEKDIYMDQAIYLSDIPCNVSLQSNKRLDKFPSIIAMKSFADRLVYNGIIPTDEARQTALRSAGSDIFINGKDPKQVIKKTQDTLMADTAKNKIAYKAVENKYIHYDQMKVK